MLIPQIGTDLFDDEEPLDSGPSAADGLLESLEIVDASVVRLVDENGDDDESSSDDGDDNDEELPAKMEEAAPKKRGRASLGAATPKGTPKAKAKATPKSSGTKRKASDDADEEPAAKRGRGRATAAAASSAIKQSSTKRAKAPNGSAKAVSIRRDPTDSRVVVC